MRIIQSLVFLTTIFCSLVSEAAIDAYPFPNDELQQRYNSLIDELRCPQCLNTNLAGSDAMIAQGLRREVHRLLLEGKNDDEILDFMQARYGDFILYRPRLMASTWLLWFGPILLAMFAAFFVLRLLRSRRPSAPLSAEQQARVESLIRGEEN